MLMYSFVHSASPSNNSDSEGYERGSNKNVNAFLIRRNMLWIRGIGGFIFSMRMDISCISWGTLLRAGILISSDSEGFEKGGKK
jgi:hypothetical protein